jgi:hypothetical protein
MYEDLAAALHHAAARKGDESYYIRMAVSYLLQDQLMGETGFGLFAFQPTDSHAMFMDHPIFVDLKDNTITDDTGTHDIDDFIKYHAGIKV